MPELAEVEYYRKQWLPVFGQVVAAVHIKEDKRVFRGVDTHALRGGLAGLAFTHSEAHGKQMCFRFGADRWLGVHLGMSGQIRIHRPGEKPDKHDHLLIRMDDDRCLAYNDPRMFGRILYSNTPGQPAWWAARPPAILSEGFTFGRMDDCLKRRVRSPVKAVLLMQETFPGIGNWMADEILWRSRILPTKLCGEISPRKRRELYGRIREVAADALRVIGTDWGDPPDDWLFNHRWKDGGRCPQTGKPLQRAQVGGRTTCWSPGWQK